MSNTPEAIFLNVASGRYPMPGFVNLDNSVFLRLLPVYKLFRALFCARHQTIFEEYLAAVSGHEYRVHNCLKPLPFPADSVTHILCSHFLEHVYRNEALKVLTDFRRVLNRNGTIHLVVPSIRFLALSYLSSKDMVAADTFITQTILSFPNRPSFLFRTLEFGGGFGLAHRWMYDQGSLSKLVREAGYRIMSQNDTPSKNWRPVPSEGEVEIVAAKV
jgi:hypothetical protein